MAGTTQIEMTRDKETKNTFRYSSPQSGDIQGSLYVQKSTGITSEKITVSVKVA